MIKTVEETNERALEQLFAEADKVLAVMARTGADALSRNLAAGQRSGVHYPGQPRQSSSPGEFSQEQTGGLRRMVAHGQSAPLEHWFGLDPQGREETEQATAQELGAPRGNLAARGNVRRTGNDPRVHADMIAKGRSAV